MFLSATVRPCCNIYAAPRARAHTHAHARTRDLSTGCPQLSLALITDSVVTISKPNQKSPLLMGGEGIMLECLAKLPNCPTIVHHDWKGEDGLYVWHEASYCEECKEHGARNWAQDLGGETTNVCHANSGYECETCTV